MTEENRRKLEEKIQKSNGILATMYDTGYGDLSVVKMFTDQSRKILGMGERPKYLPKISEIDDKTAYKLEVIMDKFINSDWTSEEGRERIFEKRLGTFSDRFKLEREDALKIYDIFETDAYHKMIEKGLMDSKQFVDLIKRNKDVQEIKIEQAVIALNQSGVQRGKARIFLTTLLKKDE